MRELVFTGGRRLEWREAAPVLLEASTDAIVRPFVAARCDGDAVFLLHDFEKLLRVGALLHVADEAFASAHTSPFGGCFAYGHECVAEVISCGPDVRQFAVGDHVIVPWAVSCGSCSTCLRGLTSKCVRACAHQPLAAFGFGAAIGGQGGMLSDAVRVPWADAMLVAVPPGVDPVTVASASDNLPDAYRTVAPHLAKTPGAPVLIVGGGAKSIGLYAAGIARALGAARVDYLDTSRRRLAIAERLGATPIEISRTSSWYREGRPDGGRNREYPITVDASSTGRGLRSALAAVAPGGVCTGIGFYLRRGTPLPLWKMYMNDVTLHIGVSHARAAIPAVLDLIARGLFDPGAIDPVVADWADAPRVLREKATKVIVRRAPSRGAPISRATL